MPITVTTADARAQFSRIADTVVATGQPVTVFKHSRPWVQITPVDAGDWAEIPNERTLAAMREVETMHGHARFDNAEDLIAAMWASADAAG
ncbi:MAG: type II toxin-antitoxin system prevent-host-death family antitoxin [Propionibacteriaceae bacterium]|nr:type II toxin-antitoxin system prevent-host-death family antitoxin [Propionibacteriaceae bacterium]